MDFLLWLSVVTAFIAIFLPLGLLALQKLQAKKQAVPNVLDDLGLDRVLVVSLQRAAANRTAFLLKQAEELELPVEVTNASDGVYDPSFRSVMLPSRYANSTCTDIIGAIFDSHERAWLRAASAARPTLILEDDVSLPDDFVELFKQRAKELPNNYDIAFVGSSTTPAASRYSAHLSRPDKQDPNLQAVLGFWGYVVSPRGAKRLRKLAKEARTSDRRLFQPVDLFIAHRVDKLKVFVFEPSQELASWFHRHPDRHHVLDTMRQVGILKVQNTPTMNRPIEDEETSEMEAVQRQVIELGSAGSYIKSWKVADKALRKHRLYSCFKSAQFLQNVGLTLLRLVAMKKDGCKELGANRTLLLALEMFSRSVVYTEGTYQERTKRNDFPMWVNHALHQRVQNRFKPVSPPNGWDTIHLGAGFSFNARSFVFHEPFALPQNRRNRSISR